MVKLLELLGNNLTISTCESCTSGLLGSELTNNPGSSSFYKGGFIVYSNEAKSKLLGIPLEFIESNGAVSSAVAAEMTAKTWKIFETDIVISITGYAGPNDGDNNGLVFISVFTKWNKIRQTHKMKFTGSRNEIRKKIVKYIVEYLDFDFDF